MIIAITVALSCSLSAFGQKNKEEKGKAQTEASAPKSKGQRGMNLSDEQKQKMKDIHLKTSKEVLPLKNQLAEKKAHLKTLTTVEKPDMNEINKTIDEMSALRNQIMKKKVAAKMEVRSILNDEQRLMFDMKDGKHGKPMKMHNRQKGMIHEGKMRDGHPCMED